MVSLRALNQSIVEFKSVSGYKINLDKSVLSGFHIKADLREEILKIMPGKWQTDGIKYLGIKICRSKEAMIKKNIIPITDYMWEKCQLWSLYPLLCMGRIATIQMVL